MPLAPGAGELLDAVASVRCDPLWAGHAEPGARAMLIAAGVVTGLEEARRLAAAHPGRPSEGVELAAGTDPAVQLVAIAAGGSWIERYLHEWSEVRLEIDGDDLIAAGIPRGPAVGAGLGGALRRKLDGELAGGREAELRAALEIAGRSG
jgi:hypothetical protein